MILESIKNALIPPAFKGKRKSPPRKPIQSKVPMILENIKNALTPPAFQGKKKSPPRRLVPAKISKVPRKAFRPEGPVSFSPLDIFLCVLAFGFAAKGQMEWARVSDNTVGIGALYYFLGIVCFLLAFRSFRHDWSELKPLPRSLEVFLLAVILGVAAFFRFYRLGAMPPGVFWDQGYEGLYAMKILNEHFRPFLEFDQSLRNPAWLIYQLAAWFSIFQPSQVSMYSFFALLSCLSFFFIYWTFRQLSGARMALFAVYILAVMRWNVNFSRNGFPTIQVPFYQFGTLAFLLYGMRNGKKWAFLASAVICSFGFYTYQAYKITPLLLLVLLGYEFFRDREGFKKNTRNLVWLFAVMAVLTLPLAHEYLGSGAGMWREQNYNIYSEMRGAHSWKPLEDMVSRTALMFNRSGDVNERHNYPNYRMLDDVTGVLFILGLAFALSRLKQRIYFYALSGFFIMCLPCLLSVDPAHANRMLGTTPFVAFLAAIPLAVLLNRSGRKWGMAGELVVWFLVLEPLMMMSVLNYKNYFVLQASNNGMYDLGVWNGYSVADTRIGGIIAKEGEAYDYYLVPRFYDYPTIDFLGYYEKDRVHKLDLPEGLVPLRSPNGKGIYFFLVNQYLGVLDYLTKLYPGGELVKIKDLAGTTIAMTYKISPEEAASARGLAGEVDGRKTVFEDFPAHLPNRSGALTLRGNVFVRESHEYRFVNGGNCRPICEIAGHLMTADKGVFLAKGFYSIRLDLRLPAKNADPKLALMGENGLQQPLDSTDLTPLEVNHGLEGNYYNATKETGNPGFVQWSPMLNFPYGVDFPYTRDPLFIHWKGTLRVPETGTYAFIAQTDEAASVEIDGKAALPWNDPTKPTSSKTGAIRLRRGDHAIDVYFRKVLGPTFSLLWTTPSDPSPKVIPPENFGATH